MQRFAHAGGTHLFLATQNYRGGPILDLANYSDQFDTTEALARRIGEETRVVAYPVLAPYPVDLLAASEQLGLAKAVELHRAAIDLAAQRVREHRAVALGEVGRPHFPVAAPEVMEASEALLDAALAAAHDADCPAIVHSEDLSDDGYRALADRGRRAGVPPERLVKHYARRRYRPPEGEGPVRSYLARRELFSEVLDDPGPWFLETDFLDDPTRPRAVLDLTTVPKRAARLAEQDPARLERLRIPFVESVHTVYGLSLITPSG